MTDEATRLNDITARFREAGFELRLYESMPGAWDAIWHPHGQGSGLVRAAGAEAHTASGATMLEAAQGALEELERTSAGDR
jgi:hypothetical protein